MSKKHKLGSDSVNLDLFDALWKVLAEDEPSPVRRQSVLELLIMRHAVGAGNREDALLIVEGVCKHARQIIEQMSAHNHRCDRNKQ
jgi:hypothetical protein